MRAYERFLKYVSVWTPSDANSETVPSADRELVLAKLLVEEMKELVERSGLVFEAAYDAVTHEEPTEKSERIYIVARESGK